MKLSGGWRKWKRFQREWGPEPGRTNAGAIWKTGVRGTGMRVPFQTALRQPDNHPAFTTGPETHGFASLPHSRFAFSCCNRLKRT